MPRTVAVLVCVVLVALVGVAGAFQPAPQSNATAEQFHQQTAAPGENESASSAYPPGASADGIENASRLMNAHRAALRNVSYRERSVWEDLTMVSRNGTPAEPEVRQYTITAENGTNGTAVDIAGGNDSNGYWFTDEATMTEVETREYGPEALYEYYRGEYEYIERLGYVSQIGSDIVAPYLRDLDYELVATESVANRTRYTYSSTGINETAQPNLGDTPLRETTESISATVVITERGIIESFSAQEVRTAGNRTITLNQTYRVTGIGETVTTPPEWVTEEVTQFDASIIGNGSVLELTHLGGPSISELGLFLYAPPAYGQILFNGTIAPGETVYLYLTVEEGSNETQLRTAREPPSVNSSFVGLAPGNVSISTYRYLFRDNEPTVGIEVTIERPTQPSGNESGTAARSWPAPAEPPFWKAS